MSEKADIRIDIEAAKALIYWKSLFADEVATRARRLAAESSEPEHVTVVALPSGGADCGSLTPGCDPGRRAIQ